MMLKFHQYRVFTEYIVNASMFAAEGITVLNSINMKEIAMLAGVSASTVSRVLNKNGRYSAETEARVLEIIRKYDYTPNMSAKGLRTSRNSFVGIIVPDITNSHFASLVLELEKAMFEEGYSCMICNTNENALLEDRHVKALMAQNARGIFITGTHIYEKTKNIPFIYLDRRPRGYHGNIFMIESDNTMGGYLATKELLDMGCKHPAILSAPNVDYNQRARFEGFKKAIRERGMTRGDYDIIDAEDTLMSTSEKAVMDAISDGVRFDGLMCTTDTMSAGANVGLRKCGISVPDDVLLTGYDDSPIAEVVGSGITSVRQNLSAMVNTAVSIFLSMLEEKAPEQMLYSIPVTLVKRDSTQKRSMK